jgi:hypothetical protein
MKILYTREPHGQDYLCDMVFHGLKSMPEHEVVDSPRLWYMYKNDFEPRGPNKLSDRTGFGFSVCALLEDDPSQVRDPEQVRENIKNHYYDLIIFGRIDHQGPHLDLVLEHYPREKIIILDGHDGGDIYPEHLPLIEKTIYFKRELVDPNPVFPISFSMPREKCITELRTKVKPFSYVRPGAGYIHNTEASYYDDYAESLFGITHKKGGWDCLRHYEILANRCVPYMPDIANVPPNVMTMLPKELMLYVKQRVDQQGPEYFMPGNLGWIEYLEFENEIHKHFITKCTTDASARYVLSKYSV